MAKLLIDKINVKVNINLDKDADSNIVGKWISGNIQLGFVSIGNMDDFMNIDGSLNEDKLANRVYSKLHRILDNYQINIS